MIVALDVDDTITRKPPFFSILTRALIDAGHEVIILTFREDRQRLERELADWGIAHSRIIMSNLDDLLAHGPDEWKAHVCRELGVEVFFEDMPEVLRHLDESVLALMPVRREKHRLELLCNGEPVQAGP